MPPSLSELKVTPSFCFAFKIPEDRAVTSIDRYLSRSLTIYQGRNVIVEKNPTWRSLAIITILEVLLINYRPSLTKLRFGVPELHIEGVERKLFS